MAVDPRIMQQYVDAYNQQLNQWQRQGKAYNTAIGSYNTAANTFNKQTQPKIQNLMGKYNYELNHLQQDIDNYNANLWASNRDDWNNALNSYQDYHYKNANTYNQQMTALERQAPKAPSAVQGLFNERLYLEQNPDVVAAVARGQFKSGLDHYLQHGRTENRNAATGGAKNEKALQQAAAWQVQSTNAFNAYMDAVQAARARDNVTHSILNAGGGTGNIQAKQNAANKRKAEYDALLANRPQPDWFASQATPGRVTNALRSGNSGDIVKAAYSAYLGRQPEAEGFNSWKTAIDNKSKTPQQVVNDIRRSAEGKDYGQQFHGQQPTFTAEQMRAMSGKVTPGQQLLAEQGGLISNERVSAATERQAPSFISGILSLARNQRS